MLLAKKRQHSTTLITDWQTFHQIEEKKNCLVCVSFALCSMVLFSVSVLFFPQRFSHSFFIAHFILLQTKKNTSLTITALKCSTSRSLDIVSLDIYSLSLSLLVFADEPNVANIWSCKDNCVGVLFCSIHLFLFSMWNSFRLYAFQKRK